MVDQASGFDIRLGVCQRQVQRRLLHEIARTLIHGQQRFDLQSQLRIAAASCVEKSDSFLRGAFARVVKESLHLLPAFNRHLLNSRSSQVRARFHSRSTVESETPNTSAVSAMVNPPK